MNCKPGDLALVVVGRNSGRMVTCIEIIEPPFKVLEEDGPLWRTEGTLYWVGPDTNGEFPYAFDSTLLPIRPDEIRDEERQEETA